ncbi:P-loop NTPase domain-containing protein LPA1 2-like [Histomonas meleagridis]|uniref:P-loop NTPase domain-containing protein LPA1-like 2-like n=1 Tax=Histomonas meleagridis TaxID=135588 RepID=UPI003559838A|nr:P-loop NTPase domain-containing protein LPA1 2-like [Histomonas meleagridis]KAH0798707.1 P-loop NTPase domain-containing protein LPA1-like 2-like [Histomonas meleagridis]
MISQEKTPREINVIYTKVDYMPDIVFENETVPIPNTSLPQYMRPYTPELLAQIFKVMGCQTPLNVSLAEWVFTFLRCCQPDQAAIILGTGYSNIFANPRSYSHGFLVLTRLQFHRLVVAALHVHQYKKIRYAVDFRLALDFFEDRRFFIVLLSGAPGTGKSTIASLLASRLPCNYILSTDSVRHAMRSFYSQEEYPILYKSTYECGDLIDPEHQLPEKERVCFF